MTRRKLLPLNKLHKKAWTIYSLWRRTKEKNFQDLVRCYTCGKWIHYKEANLGHFKHGKLDFDKRNTRIQCVTCNLYKSGRLDIYAIKLVDEIGLKEVKQLEKDAAQFVRYEREELNQIIKKYAN